MTPEEAEPVDLMIFATKEGGLRGAMETAAGFIGENTLVLSVLNGVSSEEILAERFGETNILYCTAPGHGRGEGGQCADLCACGHDCAGRKTAGRNYAARAGRCGFFECACVTAKPVGDMVRRQWGKLMLNVGLNQTVMVFEGDYGTVQQPGKPRDIMIAAMREVQKLATLEGYPISDEEFDDWVKLADSLSPGGQAQHAAGRRSAQKERSGAVRGHDYPPRGALWAGCARQPLALRYREENGSGILKKKNGGKSVVFLKSGRNCQFDSSVC